jgi:hypothetical protein
MSKHLQPAVTKLRHNQLWRHFLISDTARFIGLWLFSFDAQWASVCTSPNKYCRFYLCILVRASSYTPVNRPTDATRDKFLFSIYMCITLHVGIYKFNFSWSVRASSYIPISRPTDATCDRFLFSIYMCITLHFSSVKRSSSGAPHRTYSLQFLELKLF